jgi:transposase
MCDGERDWFVVKSLSLDLRARIVAAASSGMSRRKAAECFGVVLSMIAL